MLAGCSTANTPAPLKPFGGIIDTHTHFYDPRRPQGVPWPPPNDRVLYRPVLPAEYQALAAPHGVVGTVLVEASPWVEDNQWVLELAEREPFILGVVGNLQPGSPDFASQLNRFARNRLFRGIRVGSATLSAAQPGSATFDDLRRLADGDLSLDLLIPPEQLPAAAQLGRDLPTLRIVVDHCANVPVGVAPPNDWVGGLSACHYAENVFMKVSGLVEGTGRRGGQAPVEPTHYWSLLEALWRPFGEDRLIYGSNWPVCTHFASYATVQGLVETYFSGKGMGVAAKYFRGNAAKVYKTVKR
jgi:predicted TIM-barrel fold metal-dependent hydrolase